jgi:CubicO group peptidase (beta-lactamase class C family)
MSDCDTRWTIPDRGRHLDETPMQNPRFVVSAIMPVIFAASIGCAATYAQAGAEAVWPTKGWQTSTPEEQGMDSTALARLVEFGTTHRLDSLLIARHGKIVLDAYYAPYTADIPHVINSATKAVIGTLTAIAYKDGLLDSLNHPMLDFFGGRSIAYVDDRKKAITVQTLLDMTSGMEWEEGIEGGREQTLVEFGRSSNQIKFVLDRPMSNVPGEVFNYNSGNPNLLSAIITQLTGMTARDYGNARLFAPLGIAAPNWPHDSQGLSTGGGGLALRPRDMAKIGYLYLRNGEWDGKRLLPAGWTDRVSHATVNMNASFDPELRYANFFWVLSHRQVYMAWGYRCQFIMVFPAQDIVAVATARNDCPFVKLADDISGAVKSETALAPDPVGANLLASKILDASIEKPTAVGAMPESASAISGKTYRFPYNELTVKSLSLSLTGPQPRYELEIYTQYQSNASLQFTGPIGLDGLYRKGDSSPLGVIALKGTWLNDHAFAIDLRLVGGDKDQRWILSFDGDKPKLRGKDAHGREISIDGELGG